MSKTKINKIETLAETKFLGLYDAEYVNKKGNTKHWTIASRKTKEILQAQVFEGRKEKIDAVVIIALHKELNKLVLLRQFRVPVNDYLYELPAGLIDKDEEIFTAVERELKEETGLNLTHIDESKKLMPIYASGGMTDESMALVYCLCEGEPSTEYLEDDEEIEIMLVSQEEAENMLKTELKFDAKAYLALQSFISIGKNIVSK
ncbi:NUDIX domain-containing protein [Clostridium bovifaecis]|uniref:NUDIX domain-containing protein n=1 Tax=Clostridium bovifaecis TaxID=2184719 RepID=A0A6I6ENH2_9CLOT|nr:NUDIX domain-containing protein [Clostridium bovifaecis]